MTNTTQIKMIDHPKLKELHANLEGIRARGEITVEEIQDWIEMAFANDGPYSYIFDGYNYRKDQVALAQMIGRSIAEGKAGFGEAGTGTGKSFATLIPSAIYASIFNKRILLVTHNIALQQQLYDGDVPIVEEVLSMLGLEFKPALKKGKGNYLCAKHFQQFFTHPTPHLKEEFDRLYAAIKDEQGFVVVGDKDKFPFQPSEELWNKISINPQTDCSNCPLKDVCFEKKQNELAKESNLLISNQFMLMNDIGARRKSDYAKNSGSLPDYDILLIDEGHHIVEVASSSLGEQVNHLTFFKFMRKLEAYLSLEDSPFNELRNQIRVEKDEKIMNYKDGQLAKSGHKRERILKLQELAYQVEDMYYGVLKTERERLNKKKFGFSNYIENPYPQDIELMKKLQLELVRNKAFIEDRKTQMAIDNHARSAKELYATMNKIQEGVKNDDPNNIYWAQIDGKDYSVLNVTPLEVNAILREALFDRMPVILSSATMTFDSDIDFFAKQVGNLKPDEYHSIFIPAPFEYEEKVCFYVPENAVDCPKSSDGAEALAEYDAYCLDEMRELIRMSKGRAFILFTSSSQVKKYYDILAPEFEAMGLRCFRQGGELDRNQMIDEFIKHGNAVLFGANTFWEGISVKGRPLSLVIIHKIPFDVPTPISKARETVIEKNGGNVFLESQVFPAVIKYKQGFGRLIRHEEDQGVFCVLDGRIFSKRDTYGKYFLRGTPKCQYSVTRDRLKPFFD